MINIKKQELNNKAFFPSDEGIDVKTLLSLIEKDKYYNDVVEYFGIEDRLEEFIYIKGAKTLYTILKSISSKLIKVDIDCNLKQFNFVYKDGFKFEISDIENSEYFNDLKADNVVVKPIHSGQRDFFQNLCSIDKYADELIKRGLGDLLDYNLEQLKKKGEHIYKYRLLHDIDENSFYLRAVVSKDGYFDYNNNLTFVIALLKLHNEMLTSDIVYKLNSCEYSESFISMFFNTSKTKEMKGIGEVESILLVSNDEIRREAMKFSVIASIRFEGKNKKTNEIFIRPENVKSNVVAISHGTSPKTAFKRLEDLVNSAEIFEDLFSDIQYISRIKEYNQIAFLIRQKIENSTTEEIKKCQEELLKLLKVDIDNTIKLLEVFNKLTLIQGLEINAQDYLRYLFYDVLSGKLSKK